MVCTSLSFPWKEKRKTNPWLLERPGQGESPSYCYSMIGKAITPCYSSKPAGNGPKNGLKRLKPLLPASPYEAAGSHQLLPEVVLVRPTPGDLRTRLNPRPKQSREMDPSSHTALPGDQPVHLKAPEKTSSMLSQQPPKHIDTKHQVLH